MSNLNISKFSLFLFFLMAFVLCSCHKKEERMYVSLDDFATLRTSRYDISADRVFSNIRTLILSDKSNSPADMHARKHYNTSMEVL